MSQSSSTLKDDLIDILAISPMSTDDHVVDVVRALLMACERAEAAADQWNISAKRAIRALGITGQ